MKKIRCLNNSKIVRFSLGFIFVLLTMSVVSRISMASEIDNLIENARRGVSEDQAKLGTRYMIGHGVVKNPEEGIRWLKKAATQKNGGALFMLGKIYYNGWGVKKDTEQAIKWHRASAQTGETLSMVELGKIYDTTPDDGIFDFDESEKWYRRAIDKNNSEAMVLLGWQIYSKDKSEAVNLFRRAASLGDAQGMVAYGRMYQNGIVVSTSTIKAHMWFTLAKEKGSAEADTLARLMESEMKPHEIDTSRRYAVSCPWKRYSNCGDEN